MDDGNRAVMTSVARMYYLNGLGQSEIANIYGISRSTVSRMLTAAREQGIVRISVDESDPRDRQLEHRLMERLGLRNTIVIRAPGSSPEHIRRAVGYFAAPFLVNWIAGHSLVGIAGGRTLAELVHHIEPQHHGVGPTFLQLLGTIGSSPRQIDASEQCRGLARRFRGNFRTINLPAYAQDRHVRDLFLSHEEIQSVWRSLAFVDLALVGLGTLENSAFIERGVLDPSVLAELRSAGAVGEICGRFFDERGQECATGLRDRVIGAELDILRTCPDVTVVMSGPSRGQAMLAAVRGGIVKSIVVDQVGAQSILEAG
jgi:DNA-binding transcriptional regulator LsrR (DeoR family)